MAKYLSDGELAVITHLIRAWDAFLALPVEHPDDTADFRRLIHAAQEKVAARPAFRTINRRDAG